MDISERRVIAIVAAEEHVLKNIIVGLTSWAKHYREIPSPRKKSYLQRFPHRYRKILPYLAVSRICFTIGHAAMILKEVKPQAIIVDDKLTTKLKLSAPVIPESKAVRNKHLRALITLADNLANYARTILSENPTTKALRKLRTLEK